MKKKASTYIILILIFIGAFFAAKYFLKASEKVEFMYYDANGNLINTQKTNTFSPLSFMIKDSPSVIEIPDTISQMKLKITLVNTGNWFLNVSLAGTLDSTPITFTTQKVQLPIGSAPIVVETGMISLVNIVPNTVKTISITATAPPNETQVYNFKFKIVSSCRPNNCAGEYLFTDAAGCKVYGANSRVAWKAFLPMQSSSCNWGYCSCKTCTQVASPYSSCYLKCAPYEWECGGSNVIDEFHTCFIDYTCWAEKVYAGNTPCVSTQTACTYDRWNYDCSGLFGPALCSCNTNCIGKPCGTVGCSAQGWECPYHYTYTSTCT